MNAERKKKLEEMSAQLSTLHTALDAIKDDEVEEHTDDDDWVDELSEAVDSLDNCIAAIDNAVGG